MKLISAARVAEKHGVNPTTILKWARDGTIPSVEYGHQLRFDSAAVEDALAGHSTVAARNVQEGSRRCSKCKEAKPVEAFPMVKDSRTGKRRPCSNCSECRRMMRRAARLNAAALEGREDFRTREESRAIAKAREDARRTEVAKGKSDRDAATEERRSVREAQLMAEGREGMAMTISEVRAATERDRRKRANDPEFKARVDAQKIQRYRATKDTQVVPISRIEIAERDGWLCAICGGAVVRAEWSLDHVVPLSKGGHHIHSNVTLAHKACNSKKGAKLEYVDGGGV